jgi:5-methylcytosine-specific restriction protein B
MRKEIYARADGLERVWEHSIMPLLEGLFFGRTDLEEQYGLRALRTSIGLP